MSEPTLSGARNLDALTSRLNALRTAAGSPSYAEIARRVGLLREKRGVRTAAPGRVTVYDAFRAGRTRMDIELVADIVSVLGFASEVTQWRRAHEGIARAQAQERHSRGPSSRARVVVVDRPALQPLIGRETLLQDAVAFVATTTDRDAPRGVFVTGMPGVGKSSFAREVAARVAALQPGAQVIEVALRTNVGSEGPREGDPLEVAAAIKRSQLQRQHEALVVVLDDVFSADDLMVIGGALSAESIIVGTSRRHLEVPDSMLTVLLEPLELTDATRLLADAVHPARDEPVDDPAWENLAELCGGLPLALVMLAGQITAHSGWSLDDHVERLEHSSSSALVASLAVAYAELSPDVRRTLHLLACHQGRLTPEEADVFVRLDARSGTSTATALGELERERFIRLDDDGRYDLHDVVRAMAAEKALVTEPLSSRRQAASRLADSVGAGLAARVKDAAGLSAFVAQAEVCVTTMQLVSEYRARESALALLPLAEEWLEFAQRWQDIILVLQAVRPLLRDDDVTDLDIRLADMLLIAGRIDDAEVILLRLTSDPAFVHRRYRAFGRLGWAAALRGDDEVAIRKTTKALDGASRDGNSIGVQVLTGQLAEALCDSGRPDEAITLLEEFLGGAAEIGPERRAHLLSDLAMAAVLADRSELAHQAAAEAKAAAASITHLGLMAYADIWHGQMLLHDGEVARGLAVLTDADERLRPERANVRAATKVSLAYALLLSGDLAGAEATVVEALEMSDEYHFRAVAHQGRVVLAAVRAAHGAFGDAEDLLQGVIAEEPTGQTRADAMLQLGKVCALRGERDAARDWWRQAHDTATPLFARLIREAEASV